MKKKANMIPDLDMKKTNVPAPKTSKAPGMKKTSGDTWPRKK